MRIGFIDDSEQTNCLRTGMGHLLAFGGAMLSEEHVRGYADDLAGIKEELSIPADEEIKWKAPKGSYLAQAGGDLAHRLRTQMLQAAEAHQVRTSVVVLDWSARYTKRSKPEVGREILKWLYERFTMYCTDHGDSGVLIADKPGGGAREDSKWLADTLSLTNDGTEYVDPGRVVLPILTADSRHVPHLQLADLVVAATTAAVAGRPNALKLGRFLATIMHRHSLGDVNGAGLVLYPDQPNLYFHCFGEAGYSRPGKMAGFALPYAGYPYFDDDGLSQR